MAASQRSRMELRPTDFFILEILTRGRNTAPNIAAEKDRARKYINQRMVHLRELGMVENIGPAKESGLYEITEKGRVALEHRDKYEGESVDFEAFLDRKLSE